MENILCKKELMVYSLLDDISCKTPNVKGMCQKVKQNIFMLKVFCENLTDGLTGG